MAPSQRPEPSAAALEALRRRGLAVLTALRARDPLNIFAEPVTGVPHYRTIVKRPMCLSVAEANLRAGVYKSANQFASAVNLIWSNCMLFNEPETLFWKHASALKEVAHRLLDEMRAALVREGHFVEKPRRRRSDADRPPRPPQPQPAHAPSASPGVPSVARQSPAPSPSPEQSRLPLPPPRREPPPVKEKDIFVGPRATAAVRKRPRPDDDPRVAAEQAFIAATAPTARRLLASLLDPAVVRAADVTARTARAKQQAAAAAADAAAAEVRNSALKAESVKTNVVGTPPRVVRRPSAEEVADLRALLKEYAVDTDFLEQIPHAPTAEAARREHEAALREQAASAAATLHMRQPHRDTPLDIALDIGHGALMEARRARTAAESAPKPERAALRALDRVAATRLRSSLAEAIAKLPPRAVVRDRDAGKAAMALAACGKAQVDGALAERAAAAAAWKNLPPAVKAVSGGPSMPLQPRPAASKSTNVPSSSTPGLQAKRSNPMPARLKSTAKPRPTKTPVVSAAIGKASSSRAPKTSATLSGVLIAASGDSSPPVAPLTSEPARLPASAPVFIHTPAAAARASDSRSAVPSTMSSAPAHARASPANAALAHRATVAVGDRVLKETVKGEVCPASTLTGGVTHVGSSMTAPEVPSVEAIGVSEPAERMAVPSPLGSSSPSPAPASAPSGASLSPFSGVPNPSTAPEIAGTSATLRAAVSSAVDAVNSVAADNSVVSVLPLVPANAHTSAAATGTKPASSSAPVPTIVPPEAGAVNSVVGGSALPASSQDPTTEATFVAMSTTAPLPETVHVPVTSPAAALAPALPSVIPALPLAHGIAEATEPSQNISLASKGQASGALVDSQHSSADNLPTSLKLETSDESSPAIVRNVGIKSEIARPAASTAGDP